MTLEQQLIQKTYYQMFINEHENMHPIRVLGEVFQEEAHKDMPDLSNIRFAQGEVYFHHKDYETAIFKWENIANELEPWAKKNTADAYYELGMASTAEDIYTAIHTDDPILNAEVALKLFSLYIDRGKLDAAVSTIKRTVQQNPDYPNVTEIARTFFEDRGDWENAVELAVNEAKRTESLQWFDILLEYVEKGVTKGFAPSYFSHALTMLFYQNQKKFEQLVGALWNSCRHEDSYFTWVNEINHLLLNLDLERSDGWALLSKLHKEAYFDLINGKYFIKQLRDYVPDLLTNWLRLADKDHVVISSAAILSWNELFPASLSVSIVKEAENLISTIEIELNELQECLTLFDTIMDWAEAHDMGTNSRVKWMVEQLVDFETYRILVTGLTGSGKSTFVNNLFDEDLQDSPTSTMVMFKNADEQEITEITDFEITRLEEFADFQERMDRMRNALESIIEFKQPNGFLKDSGLAIMDTPGLKGSHHDVLEVLKNFHVADTILFVLDANTPFSEKERAALKQIQELAPDIPVHFLLSKMDTIANEHDAIRIYQEVKSTVHTMLPDAKIFAFSSQYDRQTQINELQEFIQSIKHTRNLEDKRLAKLLYYIRTMLSSFLQKRIDVENQLVEAVRWNEEMHLKLNGAINQMHDTVAHKAEMLARSYRSIKESMQEEIASAVPKMLQECSELIKEDSNFSRIHLELNDEMNHRLQEFLEEKMMPKYYRELQDWIGNCTEELEQSQEFLNELADSFNSMYGEERLTLSCDFKVLDDWRRDTDRMTNGFQLEKVNILLRRTPSQFLLKSAGKLFGALSQNKAMLHNKYKAFVENEDYTEVADDVGRQFFQPFELFEKSLERDVNMFFKGPLGVLNHSVEEASAEIQKNQELLDQMNTNPEMFRDPLTLFEVRLRQFEWMTVAGKGMQTIY
ncbi:dynamin family protein [Neobacillus kokaensis]|uniref:GTP-binding protein n=1 Tax=Neobacillus kokaensis TaxID=2759023 RepID=A0ABQ3NAU8_9BACI|nr:dynamin family protein [Neobacillus kokaensis]GHI00677.1 GTP-binding protein [Neobacillus kokaensis]